ncbi:MAG TPA: DNA replication protein DnaD [Lachnospiraceae bacterium]|nr:DNA replication protein DnaD [Lachnospiraceae bacterium]
METITITTKNKETYSAVSDFFIDYYMTDANGEFVKIYLYLVRLLHSGNAVTVAGIADHFNLTEKDICRAVKYWIKQGVLQLEYTKDKKLTGITLLPLSPKEEDAEDDTLESLFSADASEESNTTESNNYKSSTAGSQTKASASMTAATQDTALSGNNTSMQPTDVASSIADPATEQISQSAVPKKIAYKPSFIASKKEDEDFGNLLYQTETYFGKPLTQSDIHSLLYIYEELAFSPELLEYLVEYCVSINKKSCRYIEAVAIEWYKNGIVSVEDAKVASKNYNSIYVAVLKQLGIPRRVPTPTETAFIDTWYNTYSFNKNIIMEACKRAITARPHSANFNYVNGILESWHKQNVRKLSDIEELDRKWAAEKKKKSTSNKTSSNQFNNYQSSTDASVVNEFEHLFLQETNQ